MELALLLPVALASGFLYCKLSYITYIKLHRFNDQHLYLEAAIKALFPTFISSAIAMLIVISKFDLLSILNLLPSIFNETNPINKKPWIDEKGQFIAITCLLLPLISLICAKIRNAYMIYTSLNFKAYKKAYEDLIDSYIGEIFSSEFSKSISRAKNQREEELNRIKTLELTRLVTSNPLESFLVSMAINRSPVEFILTDGAVISGAITFIGEPNEQTSIGPEIELLPIVVGYISDTSKKVRLTKFYDEETRKKIPTCIKIDAIAQARPLKIDLYTKKDIDSPKQNERFKIKNRRYY